MHPLKPTEALMLVAPAILEEHFHPDCCIAATRHGIEALRYFGVEAQPVKVQTFAGNADWIRWIEQLAAAGRSPDDEAMPDGSWSVGIDLSADGVRATSARGRYPGHLVFVADGFLIDLSLGQMSRPERGMTLPFCAAFDLSGHERWDNDGAGFRVEHLPGEVVAVIYKRLPEVDWRDAPDWRRKPPYAGEIIRAMKRAMLQS